MDCLDPDCFRSDNCDGPGPDICGDGLDNDGDRLVDCQDPECAGQAGPEGQRCQLTETICGDGLDNDGDGAVDCDDPGCASSPPCQ